MKCTGFPILEVSWLLIVGELKYLYTDSVASGHMGNFERTPTRPKDIDT
jgi:hypothetical protein